MAGLVGGPSHQVRAPDRGAILLIEAEPLLRRAIAEALQQGGYRVVSARDGADALRVLDHAIPWLILLDAHLPVMGGAEFAHEVRRRGIETKLVVMTGAGEASRWARELGADGYVEKPFLHADLLEEVARHGLRTDGTETRE